VGLSYASDEIDVVKPKYRVNLRQAHKGTLEVDTHLIDSYGRLKNEYRNFYFQSREILVKSPEGTIEVPTE